VEAHGEDLRQVTGDDKLAEDVKRDFEEAHLDEGTKALLRFACRVTHEAASMSRADVDALREKGFSDRAILDATLVASLFNYFNRVADALGIDLEEGMPPRPPKESSP
jgi:uncharacterized peroxidase-related enzyme